MKLFSILVLLQALIGFESIANDYSFQENDSTRFNYFETGKFFTIEGTWVERKKTYREMHRMDNYHGGIFLKNDEKEIFDLQYGEQTNLYFYKANLSDLDIVNVVTSQKKKIYEKLKFNVSLSEVTNPNYHILQYNNAVELVGAKNGKVYNIRISSDSKDVVQKTDFLLNTFNNN